MRWVVAMSISKDRRRRTKKPLIACSRNSSTCNRGSVRTTSIILIALTTLLIGGSFVLIISPTLVASALAQEWVPAIAITGASATTANTTTTEASPPPGTGFSPQSDLNFSDFPEFNEFLSESEDLASPSTSFMTDVNGTYTNPNIGFQIDLPTGWKGKEITF